MSDKTFTDEAEQAFRIERAPAEKFSDYAREQQAFRENFERLRRERLQRENDTSVE